MGMLFRSQTARFRPSRQLTLPILAIGGDNSWASFGRQMALAAGRDRCVVEGSGHWLLEEQLTNSPRIDAFL
jgi:pimeloyl-ACP methyl ester carboxylesterase